jgi:hypothetical protein
MSTRYTISVVVCDSHASPMLFISLCRPALRKTSAPAFRAVPKNTARFTFPTGT